MVVELLEGGSVKYRGKIYNLTGKYYARNGKRLHRAVYEGEIGEIPKGFDVHHIDHNKHNNEPENLLALSRSDHIKLHAATSTWIGSDANLELMGTMQDLAKEWHGSAKGNEWHKKHYESMKDKLYRKINLTCMQCGKEYEGLYRKEQTHRFCGKNCKATYRRKSGVDNEERSCTVCSSKFTVNKYAIKKTCSKVCANEASSKTKLNKSNKEIKDEQ